MGAAERLACTGAVSSVRGAVVEGKDSMHSFESMRCVITSVWQAASRKV